MSQIGQAAIRRQGDDITLVSVGVGVHRALAVAESLEKDGVSAGVVDLRTVWPLDKKTICEAVVQTERLLVIDEDYEAFGLSGELAAIVSEAGIPFQFARVCTQTTIPYARHLEDQILPNKQRIRQAVAKLIPSFSG